MDRFNLRVPLFSGISLGGAVRFLGTVQKEHEIGLLIRLSGQLVELSHHVVGGGNGPAHHTHQRKPYPRYSGCRLIHLVDQFRADKRRIGPKIEVEIIGTVAEVKGPRQGLCLLPLREPPGSLPLPSVPGRLPIQPPLNVLHTGIPHNAHEAGILGQRRNVTGSDRIQNRLVAQKRPHFRVVHEGLDLGHYVCITQHPLLEDLNLCSLFGGQTPLPVLRNGDNRTKANAQTQRQTGQKRLKIFSHGFHPFLRLSEAPLSSFVYIRVMASRPIQPHSGG